MGLLRQLQRSLHTAIIHHKKHKHGLTKVAGIPDLLPVKFMLAPASDTVKVVVAPTPSPETEDDDNAQDYHLAERTVYVESEKVHASITSKTYNFNARQVSTLNWATVWNNTTTGVNYVELSRAFKLIEKIKPQYTSKHRILTRTNRLDNLSNSIYGTPYLWWAIYVANMYQMKTPFVEIPAGTEITAYSQSAIMEALTYLKSKGSY